MLLVSSMHLIIVNWLYIGSRDSLDKKNSGKPHHAGIQTPFRLNRIQSDSGKNFGLKTYVLFMCASGEPGSGTWLFISFLPPHLKMWILRSFEGLRLKGAHCSHNPAFPINKLTQDVLNSYAHHCHCSFTCPCRISLYTSVFLSFLSGDMLDLLKWRAHPERINDSLSKLKEIDGSEIVKVGPRSYSQQWLDCFLIWFQAICLLSSNGGGLRR